MGSLLDAMSTSVGPHPGHMEDDIHPRSTRYGLSSVGDSDTILLGEPLPEDTEDRATEKQEYDAKRQIEGETTEVQNDDEARDPEDSKDSGIVWVDWDGPSDPANPKNWPDRKKWAATLVVSSFTFISPVSSSMVAPATEQVAQQFGITDTVLMAMITSAFVLGFCMFILVLKI
ncbi:hypothetical protein BDN70DRAFT_886439 [Pholiota conissans]|uniref:Major facilitator superfamily (MFS) profile domain-containing protein n=1 Tax=Pholiota conissans TaxID=109636 RepID=A0A9P5YS17_9AGAR|nr:hypothetical protein BDN70DRAFT_886439 [Pholiota conissans]